MKVKFLVDECTGKRLSNLLNVAGYDTIFVAAYTYTVRRANMKPWQPLVL